jgi:dTDP-4-amino-4,6-dideoxygalactose transaminase
MRMLRDHGQARKYYHDIEGYNGRLDSIQAGILTAKLTHLTHWNSGRHVAAQRYDNLLSSVQEVVCPYCPDWARAVFHLYVVRVEDREGLQKHLAEANIGTGIHYPAPLHLQKAYESLGHKRGDFPVTERIAAEIVSLPMFPHITVDQQSRVVEAIKGFLATPTAPEKVGAHQD